VERESKLQHSSPLAEAPALQLVPSGGGAGPKAGPEAEAAHQAGVVRLAEAQQAEGAQQVLLEARAARAVADEALQRLSDCDST